MHLKTGDCLDLEYLPLGLMLCELEKWNFTFQTPNCSDNVFAVVLLRWLYFGKFFAIDFSICAKKKKDNVIALIDYVNGMWCCYCMTYRGFRSLYNTFHFPVICYSMQHVVLKHVTWKLHEGGPLSGGLFCVEIKPMTSHKRGFMLKFH